MRLFLCATLVKGSYKATRRKEPTLCLCESVIEDVDLLGVCPPPPPHRFQIKLENISPEL